MARTALAALAAVLVIALPAASSAATATVQITRAGFIPNTLTIKMGDTVTWTNADTQNRQVVSRDADATFASPVLAPTQQFSYTFAKAGRFRVEDPLQKPTDRMTVIVEEPPPSLTVAAAPVAQVYGGAVTLSGRVSNGAANERVTVQAQACGGAFARVADVTTTTGGAWTLSVKPLNATSYRAQWKTATSPTVAAKVRPAVKLRRLAPKRFSVRVSAAASFAGKVGVLQRYNATLRAWVRVRTVTLKAVAGGVAPTVISGLTFRANVVARRRLRVVLPQAQVGACYLPGTSNTVLS